MSGVLWEESLILGSVDRGPVCPRPHLSPGQTVMGHAGNSLGTVLPQGLCLVPPWLPPLFAASVPHGPSAVVTVLPGKAGKEGSREGQRAMTFGLRIWEIAQGQCQDKPWTWARRNKLGNDPSAHILIMSSIKQELIVCQFGCSLSWWAP